MATLCVFCKVRMKYFYILFRKMLFLKMSGQQMRGLVYTVALEQADLPSFLPSSASSVGATARCGLWPVEKYLSIFPYLSPTLSIFSLPVLEDLFSLLLSILSWVFLFEADLPVLRFSRQYHFYIKGDVIRRISGQGRESL
jgi:hypothetical protein